MELERVSNINVSLSEQIGFPDLDNAVGSLCILGGLSALFREWLPGQVDHGLTGVFLGIVVYGILMSTPDSSSAQEMEPQNSIFIPSEIMQIVP